MQGTAPTISIDNTAGCQLYLSKDSLQASITTAKSSEINVLVPGAGADSDWVRILLIDSLFPLLILFVSRFGLYRAGFRSGRPTPPYMCHNFLYMLEILQFRGFHEHVHL